MAHKAFIISHTHWDREWYQPFQEFRLRLVKLVDNLLDIMASDPDYRFFMLDGQTVVLEDYLEVRPEREPKSAPWCNRAACSSAPGSSCPTSSSSAPKPSCATCSWATASPAASARR